MRGEIFLIDLEIFDFLTVSVMCDGNNSLWSGSELGVQNQNGHDDHQSYHSSSKAVNNQGFGNKVRHGREDFIFDFFSSWSQSLGAIIVGVHEERHPVEVGQTESEECLLDEASAAGGHGHHKGRDTKSRVNGHQSRPKGCGSGLTTQQKQKAEETDDELKSKKSHGSEPHPRMKAVEIGYRARISVIVSA